MKTLIRNIKELVNVDESGRLMAKGEEMSKLQTIKDAYLIINDDKIQSYGKMSDLKPDWDDDEEKSIEIDATGKMVFPSFCDSHTHLVYAGSREIEYSDKIRGLSYEEIAKRGGGILIPPNALETPAKTNSTTRQWNASTKLFRSALALWKLRVATDLIPKVNSRCCA